MAKAKKDKDVLTRLADRGEEALNKLADLPGGTKALKALNDLRERVDELGKKVRGIDTLEARIDKLEKELAALRRQAKPTATRAASRAKSAATRKPPADRPPAP
jgi:outer membrane murein-binding lipoprotein Lpp